MQTMEENYYETWWSSKYPLNKKKKPRKSRKNGKKRSNKRWYIALDREGHRRSGRKSRHTQRFTHFLTRPVDYLKVPFLFEARYAGRKIGHKNYANYANYANYKIRRNMRRKLERRRQLLRKRVENQLL